MLTICQTTHILNRATSRVMIALSILTTLAEGGESVEEFQYYVPQCRQYLIDALEGLRHIEEELYAPTTPTDPDSLPAN